MAKLKAESFVLKLKRFKNLSQGYLSPQVQVQLCIVHIFEYPSDIRRVIYTTNAVESANMSLHKVIKNKRVFPSDEAAFKQLYLTIQNISKKWTMPIRNWGPALNHFMIMFPEAFN